MHRLIPLLTPGDSRWPLPLGLREKIKKTYGLSKMLTDIAK
jgi:hypothetical protein